jgi:hypothetical protein
VQGPGERHHALRRGGKPAREHAAWPEFQDHRDDRRGDALDKRRQLMEAWADFLTKSEADNVVPLRRRLTG